MTERLLFAAGERQSGDHSASLSQMDSLQIAVGTIPKNAGDMIRPQGVLRRNCWAVFAVTGAIICQLILLAIAGWQNRQVLSQDGIQYIAASRHYIEGHLDLAVNGYWGPLLSWLMIPIIILTDNSVLAARIVMGFSAVVFLLGSILVLRALQVHPAGVVLGTWIVSLASIDWSVSATTPDLLMGGAICFAICGLMSHGWLQNRRTQFLTGILFGLAYLAKSVVLPMTFLLLVGIGSLWTINRFANPKLVLRGFVITLLGFGLIALPWLGVLSLKYHRFVFSTSANIAHIIVGPLANGHPAIYNVPEPGRNSWWEDPPYKLYSDIDWSPFQSRAYFMYQLGVIAHNTGTTIDFLSTFDRFHLGFVAALLALFTRAPWNRLMAIEKWRWAGPLIICSCCIYLPVYAAVMRYFYFAYPLLIAAGFGFVVSLTDDHQVRFNWPRVVAIGVVAVSFIGAQQIPLRQSLTGLDRPAGKYAYEIVKKMQISGTAGPVAAAGNVEAVAEFVSFIAREPYYGVEPNPTFEQIKQSGADLLVVDGGLSSLVTELSQDSASESFATIPTEEGKALIRVYRVVHHN